MNLFRVTMTGHGLQLCLGNAAPVDVGFVKNQFVLAESGQGASRKAIEQMRFQLQQQADAGGLVLKSIDIEIDEIIRTMKFWKLVQQEGFIFFPKEKVPGEGGRYAD